MKKLNKPTLTKEQMGKVKAMEHRVDLGNNQSYLLLTNCSPCEKTSPNGGCFMVDETCTWIPEIG